MTQVCETCTNPGGVCEVCRDNPDLIICDCCNTIIEDGEGWYICARCGRLVCDKCCDDKSGECCFCQDRFW